MFTCVAKSNRPSAGLRHPMNVQCIHIQSLDHIGDQSSDHLAMLARATSNDVRPLAVLLPSDVGLLAIDFHLANAILQALELENVGV